MIVSTCETVPGREIVAVLGLARGNTIRARHIGRDITAGIKGLLGGEIQDYTKLMAESREQAIDRMVAHARELGADAVVGVRIGTSMVMQLAAEIVAIGTAVWVSQVCSEQPLNRTADHVGDDRFPSWSPDGSQIAFWSTRNDGGIYVMPALAGGARRLSGTASGPNRPQWSRDGQEIAYKVGNNIEILSVSTGDTHRIVPQHSQGIFDLAWSPDGRFFAFIHARGNLAAQVTQLVLLRVSDGKEFEITDGVTNVWSPAWRDGSRTLAYVSNRGGPRDLWIQRLKEDGEPASEPTQMTTGLEILSANFSVDGGRVAYSKGRYISNVWRVPILEDRVATWDDAERITHDQADVEFVDVSPDGTELAVSSDRSGEPNLWILPSSGGEMRSLTTDPTPDWQPDYSPDGKEILFYAFRSGNRDLWVVPAAGGAARQLTTHEARDSYPTWSPDGTRIAFDSERSGNADIWLLTVASGEIERLTTEPRGERHPTWSPDGEWVVFFSGGRPWRIPAHGGEPESLGTTSSGFGRFSPDGRSLYVSHIDNGAGNVWVIDPETKVERAVTKLEGRLGALGVRALATDGRYIYFTWRWTSVTCGSQMSWIEKTRRQAFFFFGRAVAFFLLVVVFLAAGFFFLVAAFFALAGLPSDSRFSFATSFFKALTSLWRATPARLRAFATWRSNAASMLV